MYRNRQQPPRPKRGLNQFLTGRERCGINPPAPWRSVAKFSTAHRPLLPAVQRKTQPQASNTIARPQASPAHNHKHQRGGQRCRPPAHPVLRRRLCAASSSDHGRNNCPIIIAASHPAPPSTDTASNSLARVFQWLRRVAVNQRFRAAGLICHILSLLNRLGQSRMPVAPALSRLSATRPHVIYFLRGFAHHPPRPAPDSRPGQTLRPSSRQRLHRAALVSSPGKHRKEPRLKG